MEFHLSKLVDGQIIHITGIHISNSSLTIFSATIIFRSHNRNSRLNECIRSAEIRQTIDISFQ